MAVSKLNPVASASLTQKVQELFGECQRADVLRDCQILRPIWQFIQQRI